jgi:hypothetical protein
MVAHLGMTMFSTLPSCHNNGRTRLAYGYKIAYLWATIIQEAFFRNRSHGLKGLWATTQREVDRGWDKG